MNYLKLSSIANLQLGKRDCEKRFVQNQSAANKFINQNHKTNYDYNEAQEVVGISTTLNSDGRKVKFNQTGEGSRIQGKILEEQLKLRSLESEYDLEKSRIQDEQNAKTFRIRYPYGKQNVRITEDVLEKYKGNNQDQTSVLKRFEEQAKQLRQLKNTQKRLYLESSYGQYNPRDSEFKEYRTSRKKVTSILQKQKNKLYRAKQQYLKESILFDQNVVQRSRELQRKENKRIENIENMLKDVRDKMNQNFSLIVENQDQNRREKRFVRRVDVARARLQNLRAVDMSEEIERRKVPVVVYNNVKGQQYNFADRSLCLDIIDFERPEKVDKPEEFQKVLKIYHMNKIRLDRLCQRVSVGDNQSSIIY